MQSIFQCLATDVVSVRSSSIELVRMKGGNLKEHMLILLKVAYDIKGKLIHLG